MSRLDTLLEHLKSDEAESFLYFAIAKEYESLGQWHEAITYYDKLKAIDEAYVGMYYHLGKAWEELDSKDKAMAAYDHGIMIAKKQADFHALSELLNAKQNLEIE